MSVYADIAVAMDKAVKFRNNLRLPDAAREYNNLIQKCNTELKLIMYLAESAPTLPSDFVWVECSIAVKEPGFVVSNLLNETTRKVVGNNIVKTFKDIVFIPGYESESHTEVDRLAYCYRNDSNPMYKLVNMCYLRNVEPVSYDPLSNVSLPTLNSIYKGLELVEKKFVSK